MSDSDYEEVAIALDIDTSSKRGLCESSQTTQLSVLPTSTAIRTVLPESCTVAMDKRYVKRAPAKVEEVLHYLTATPQAGHLIAA